MVNLFSGAHIYTFNHNILKYMRKGKKTKKREEKIRLGIRMDKEKSITYTNVHKNIVYSSTCQWLKCNNNNNNNNRRSRF